MIAASKTDSLKTPQPLLEDEPSVHPSSLLSSTIEEVALPAGSAREVSRLWWQAAIFAALLVGTVVVVGVLTRGERGVRSPTDGASRAVDRDQTTPANPAISP